MKQTRGKYLNSLANVNPNIKFNMKLRFSLVGSGLSGGITDLAITNVKLGDCVIIAATATTGFQLADQFRIKRITIQQCSGAGGTAEVAIDATSLNPNLASDGRRVVGESLGASGIAYAVYMPRKGEIMFDWQNCNSSNQLFTLSASAGNSCIVEVDVDFRTNIVLGAVGTGSALSGASAGQIYFRGLDALPLVSSVLRPLGVPLSSMQ